MGNETGPSSEVEERPQARREWAGWLRSIVLPLAVLTAIVAGLFYYEARGSGSRANGGFGTVDLPAARNVSGKAPAPAVDRQAPDFLLESLDGEALRLSDFQGQALIVNFWATWCTPCRLETPMLIQTYERNRGQGLVIVGVNIQEADERARAFASEFGVSYAIVMDRRGEVAKTWRVGGAGGGLPTTYFIDSRGVTRKIVLGALQQRDLDEGLALVLGQAE